MMILEYYDNGNASSLPHDDTINFFHLLLCSVCPVCIAIRFNSYFSPLKTMKTLVISNVKPPFFSCNHSLFSIPCEMYELLLNMLADYQ